MARTAGIGSLRPHHREGATPTGLGSCRTSRSTPGVRNEPDPAIRPGSGAVIGRVRAAGFVRRQAHSVRQDGAKGAGRDRPVIPPGRHRAGARSGSRDRRPAVPGDGSDPAASARCPTRRRNPFHFTPRRPFRPVPPPAARRRAAGQRHFRAAVPLVPSNRGVIGWSNRPRSLLPLSIHRSSSRCGTRVAAVRWLSRGATHNKSTALYSPMVISE
jgi:hypothetical protein